MRLPTLLALALLPAAGCEPAAAAGPDVPDAPRAASAPQERSVLDAMAAFKAAVVASDTAALKRLWADDYAFIDPRGRLVTRAQRLANYASGATDVAVIDAEREITVRVDGDAAVVQNLSSLRGQFSGQPTDTDLRGTFVWERRGGRWQLVTNQLTAVAPSAVTP
ncbi:nuclear transport factor 2 family protein [Roseisolibacter sp. H3M3-2]|uniref:nuclear transport factor 2 family protein n=1 Tax=Roseisolibacter sp. H3M3-2 TaxID=3031323 RepID=UPI0023DA2932|nr:nuclear transport factor 2 family protein [Roseisolibacter sp. H3M3-2]MDF1505485.1 nuclear transport factor 2 family protein [Roseisolibacter sp. H3M3-2]